MSFISGSSSICTQILPRNSQRGTRVPRNDTRRPDRRTPNPSRGGGHREQRDEMPRRDLGLLCCTTGQREVLENDEPDIQVISRRYGYGDPLHRARRTRFEPLTHDLRELVQRASKGDTLRGRRRPSLTPRLSGELHRAIFVPGLFRLFGIVEWDFAAPPVSDGKHLGLPSLTPHSIAPRSSPGVTVRMGRCRCYVVGQHTRSSPPRLHSTCIRRRMDQDLVEGR